MVDRLLLRFLLLWIISLFVVLELFIFEVMVLSLVLWIWCMVMFIVFERMICLVVLRLGNESVVVRVVSVSVCCMFLFFWC